MKYTTIINGTQYEIEIQKDGSLLVNGKHVSVDFLSLDDRLYSLIKDVKSHELAIDEQDGTYEILLEGRLYEGQVYDERALLMANRRGGLRLDTGEVHSPMPGLIVEVLVKVGDTVNEGDTVAILESMKMQNELKAPRSGIVQSVNVDDAQTVDKNALLIIIGDE